MRGKPGEVSRNKGESAGFSNAQELFRLLKSQKALKGGVESGSDAGRGGCAPPRGFGGDFVEI